MTDCHKRDREPRAEWRPRPDGLEESVQFTPGYNCSDNSMQGHGVHGMEIWWWLRGPAGAANLSMMTGWTPGELRPGHGLPPIGAPREHWLLYARSPSSGWLGYHARRPQYEGQDLEREDCPVIGGPCYVDGTYSGAKELAERFVVDGERVIWAELERFYQRLVDEESDAAAAARQQ